MDVGDDDIPNVTKNDFEKAALYDRQLKGNPCYPDFSSLAATQSVMF